MTFSLRRLLNRSWICKSGWCRAMLSIHLQSSEGWGTLALESIQRGAFGFLHLSRSPRHGMLSSARRGAFWGCLRNDGPSGLLMRREAVVSFFPALNGSLDVTTDRNHWKDKQQGASQEHPVLLRSSRNLILVSSVAAECQYEQRWMTGV